MSNEPADGRYPFEIAAGIDAKLINFAYPPSNNRRYAIKEDWEAAMRELSKEEPPVSNITEERIPLLPCPFCGASPISHSIEPHKHEIAFGGFKMPDHAGSHVIECARCECGMIGDTQAEVVAAWNRRASAPVLSEEQREALEAGAMALYDDNCFIESRRGVARTVVERDLMVAQAALLRAMAERGG